MLASTRERLLKCYQAPATAVDERSLRPRTRCSSASPLHSPWTKRSRRMRAFGHPNVVGKLKECSRRLGVSVGHRSPTELHRSSKPHGAGLQTSQGSTVTSRSIGTSRGRCLPPELRPSRTRGWGAFKGQFFVGNTSACPRSFPLASKRAARLRFRREPWGAARKQMTDTNTVHSTLAIIQVVALPWHQWSAAGIVASVQYQ